MATQDYPLINGTAYEFAKVEIRIGKSRFKRVKSINYKDELQPGKGRGTSPQNLIRTTGHYDADGNIEIYRDEWENIKTELGGDGFMETEFLIVVSYRAKNKPMMVDELQGCRICVNERSGDDGNADPLTLKHDLDIMQIKDNGKFPVAGMVG